MKRQVTLLLLLFLICFPSLALADDWPITSPFGWREHPIFGTTRFHDGVDFGLDEGVAVPAAHDGTITLSQGFGSGNMVIIDHGDGTSTEYLHLSGFAVKGGEKVAKGQTIGYVGSTGWSTGPHLHLSYYVGDVPNDPVPYLQSQGWAISNIPDPSAVATGPLDDLLEFEGYGEMPWDLVSFYEFGKTLEDTIKTYADASKTAFTGLHEEAVYLIWILAVIDLAWFGISNVLKQSAGSFNDFIIRILRYGFVLFLINNWPEIVDDVIGSIFSAGATEFFGGNGVVADNFSKPGDVLSKGVKLIEPAFAYIGKTPFTVNIIGILFCEVIACLILLMFILIGLWLVMLHIEFYVIAAVAVLSLPFTLVSGLFSGAKSFPGGVFGSLIASAIKIFAASIVITIVINYLSPMQPIQYEHTTYLKMLVSCFLFFFLVKRIPSTVANFLNGRINF